jgi:hypothetical protein
MKEKIREGIGRGNRKELKGREGMRRAGKGE